MVHVPLITALLVAVWVLITRSTLRAGHALVCVLLGFYLASSSVAPSVRAVVAAVLDAVGALRL